MLIDTAAIGDNVRRVLEILGSRVKLVAALKANAYGHGLLTVAESVMKAGATGLAVGDLESAVELRKAGFEAPIVVYPGVAMDRGSLGLAARLDLMLTLVDAKQAHDVSAMARLPVKVLLKVDVGHERLGVAAEHVGDTADTLAILPRIQWVGVLAHVYFGPHSEKSAVQWQLDRMTRALDDLESRGPLPEFRFAASTGPLSIYKDLQFDSRLNFADPGRLLLGLMPPRIADNLGLRPAMATLASELLQVREFPPSASPVTPYGLSEHRRIGVFAMGRADGLASVHTGRVIIRDEFAPIIGEWIEHTTIDLSGVPRARPGDQVVIIGEQGKLRISPQDVLRAHPRLGLVDVPLSIHSSVPRTALVS